MVPSWDSNLQPLDRKSDTLPQHHDATHPQSRKCSVCLAVLCIGSPCVWYYQSSTVFFLWICSLVVRFSAWLHHLSSCPFIFARRDRPLSAWRFSHKKPCSWKMHIAAYSNGRLTVEWYDCCRLCWWYLCTGQRTGQWCLSAVFIVHSTTIWWSSDAATQTHCS